MKHRWILILAIIILLKTFEFNLYAEEDVDKDTKILQQIGMLVGPEGGIKEEYLKSKVKRFQVAIMLIRLTGNESHVKDYLGKGNFADADLVDKKMAKYLSYLYDHPELGMVGIGNKKFDPNSYITAKDYYKVMLEALGYKCTSTTTIGDYEYRDILAFALSKGLSKTAAADPFTVRDMAAATIETLKSEVKGSEQTLIKRLIEKKIIDYNSVIEVY